MGIHHIETLNETKLNLLIDNWNNKKVTITEKIDGSYMKFGLKNKNFFLGSKNITFNRFDNIPELFFYDEFKRYYKTFCKIPIENILIKLEKKYNLKLPRIFEGEAIPNKEHNIISYDLNKINNGVFIFFKTFEIDNENLWNDLVKQFNIFSVIKFYNLPKINTDLKLNKSIDIKTQILNNLKFNPLFGQNYEGVVIESNKELIKVVDKEKFNKIKELNWSYINLAIKYKNKFKIKTKKNTSDLKNNLELWLNELNELEKDFLINGQKKLTIKKKKNDTLKYFKFCREKIINELVKRLENESYENIFNDFLNKKYSNKIKKIEDKKHNKIFKNVNSCIPKHLLETNVRQCLELINLKNLDFNIIGNKAAKYVGDIDIAISKKDILNYINLNNDFWKDVENHLLKTKINFSINKGLKQFHILKPLQDENYNHISAIDNKGIEIKEPAFIQLDFFIGNIEWMNDILSGKPNKSNFKASYRNILLRSIFSSLLWQNKNNFYSCSIDWKDGIKICTNKIVPPTTSRQYTYKIQHMSEKLFINNSDHMARFLFGKKIIWEDINSFEKLFQLYNSEKFKFKNIKHIINQILIINLTENNMEIPELISTLLI